MRLFELSQGKNSFYVCFGGRFQPFHLGHFQVYKLLVKKFGQANVYLCTSDKTNLDPAHGKISPFNFEDKVKIMTEIYKIDRDKIIKTNSPIFASTESLVKSKPNQVFITVTGAKDVSRFERSDSYEQISLDMLDGDLSTISDKKFYYLPIAPQEEGLSSTKVRHELLRVKTESEKEAFFKKIFGTSDTELFDFVKEKIKQVRA